MRYGGSEVRRRHEDAARVRATVHTVSGKRLGDAHPQQEGPTDLRLVPAALAAWATAAVTLDASSGWGAAVAVGCLVLACVLLSRRWRGMRSLGGGARVPVAAVLLCVAAAAVSAGLHGADLRRGPVPALARQYATVTAEVQVTSDPGSPALASPGTTRPRPPSSSAPTSGGWRRRTAGWWLPGRRCC